MAYIILYYITYYIYSALPAPQMSTVLPRATPALRQAWMPTDRGSIKAPSSNVTLSGNLQRKPAQITTFYQSIAKHRQQHLCLMVHSSLEFVMTWMKVFYIVRRQCSQEQIKVLTCSRSWRCVCSICKGCHHQGVWRRRILLGKDCSVLT